MLFRQQHPRGVCVAPGDMAVDVDGAGHDDLAGHAVFGIEARVRAGIGGDPAILDEEIADFAIPALGRVVKPAAGQFDAHGFTAGQR